MQYTFHIDDNNPKAKAFLEFIKTLDFIHISDDNEKNIPQAQKDEVNRRVQLIKEGKMTTRSWDEAKKDVFKPKNEI